jgi:hypothetical protein
MPLYMAASFLKPLPPSLGLEARVFNRLDDNRRATSASPAGVSSGGQRTLYSQSDQVKVTAFRILA